MICLVLTDAIVHDSLLLCIVSRSSFHKVWFDYVLCVAVSIHTETACIESGICFLLLRYLAIGSPLRLRALAAIVRAASLQSILAFRCISILIYCSLVLH